MVALLNFKQNITDDLANIASILYVYIFLVKNI